MIYDGNKEISAIYDGGKEVVSVFDGSKEVWSNNKIIDLGEGTTFNVANFYQKYRELTIDNFFFTSVSSLSKALWYRLDDGERKDIGAITRVEKSYNSSTGVLTLRNYLKVIDGVSYNKVHAFLVVKPIKLSYLGEGTIFDVKGIKNYKKLTVNDFLIKETTQCGKYNTYYANPDGYDVSASSPITSTIVKTYDSENGILTCYLQCFISGGAYMNYISGTYKGNIKVYVNSK